MANFELRIKLHNVAKGDATSLAQRIWDESAEDYDAGVGDFTIDVLSFDHPAGNLYNIDWVPDEA